MLIEAPLKTGTVVYPESDGKPMAETGIHVLLIAYLIGMLRAFFRHRPDVYVSGNMFMYYEEGNPKRVVAPDVYVAFGAVNANVERRSWFVWNGTRLLLPEELAEVNLELRTQLEEEIVARRGAEAARQAAEAELARLRAELARLKGEAPQ